VQGITPEKKTELLLKIFIFSTFRQQMSEEEKPDGD
jgi:hypothetical protein